MSAKFDAESLIDSLLSLMTTGGALNAKIAAIETEKGALTPGLAAIGSGSYYAQTWTSKMLNTTPAIFYGIEDVDTKDGGGSTGKTYRCFVECVVVDNGMTNDVYKRILRYSRALEELFKESFMGVAQGFANVKIDQVRPMAFKVDVDSDDEVKVGGIALQITLFD